MASVRAAGPGHDSRLYRLLARNTASNGLFFVLQQLLGLLAFVVLIRAMPREDFGTLLLAQALVGQFALFDAGLSVGLERFVPVFRGQDRLDQIERAIAVTMLVLIIAAVVVGLVLLALVYLPADSSSELLGRLETGGLAPVLVIAMVVVWPLKALHAAGRGFNEHHAVNTIEFLELTAGAVVILALVYLEASITAIFICSQVPFLFGAGARWGVLRRNRLPRVVRIDLAAVSLLRELFGFSVWVFVMRMCSQWINQLDRILVAALLGVAAVPIYHGIMRVIRAMVQANAVLMSAVVPVAAEIFSRDDTDAFNQLARRGLRTLNAAHGAMTALFVVLAHPILHLLGGDSLSQHAASAQVAMLVYLLVNGRGFLTNMHIGAGEIVVRLAIFALATAVLYTVLALAGMRWFGLPGAILAAPGAHLLLLPVWMRFVLPSTGLSLRSFLSSVVAGQWCSWAVLLIAAPWLAHISSLPAAVAVLAVGVPLGVVLLLLAWWVGLESTIRVQLLDQFSQWTRSTAPTPVPRDS